MDRADVQAALERRLRGVELIIEAEDLIRTVRRTRHLQGRGYIQRAKRVLATAREKVDAIDEKLYGPSMPWV